MICGWCNSENPEGNLYCGRCGNALVTGTAVGTTTWGRMGKPLMTIGSLLLVLSFVLSIYESYSITYLTNGFADGDISQLYPLMTLINLLAPLGTGLLLLGTAFLFNGQRSEGDGRGVASTLIMSGAIVFFLGTIVEIGLIAFVQLTHASFFDRNINYFVSSIGEIGIVLFLIGLIVWLLRTRPSLHSRSGAT